MTSKSRGAARNKINRTGWPAGPWDTEPDRVEWRDEVTKLPCLIIRNHFGGLCGYVGVPPGHLWHGKDCDDVPAKVHGGLTYASKCAGHICHVPLPGEPDNVWWLGFDCVHSDDLVPGMLHYQVHDEQYPLLLHDGQYRDMTYVRREVTDLARQIHEAR